MQIVVLWFKFNCYDNSLVLNGCQAIIWTNDGLVYWHIYGSPDLDKLTLCGLVMPCGISELGDHPFRSLHWRHNDHDGVSNHQPHGCTQSFIQTQIKENIKAPRHWPLCGEFNRTGEFPAQRASYTENVFIWRRHHVMSYRNTSASVQVKAWRWPDDKSCHLVSEWNHCWPVNLNPRNKIRGKSMNTNTRTIFQ